MLDLTSEGWAEVTVGRGAYAETFSLFGIDGRHYNEMFAENFALLLQPRRRFQGHEPSCPRGRTHNYRAGLRTPSKHAFCPQHCLDLHPKYESNGAFVGGQPSATKVISLEANVFEGG